MANRVSAERVPVVEQVAGVVETNRHDSSSPGGERSAEQQIGPECDPPLW
jgi:hypothetical protein